MTGEIAGLSWTCTQQNQLARGLHRVGGFGDILNQVTPLLKPEIGLVCYFVQLRMLFDSSCNYAIKHLA